MRRCWLLFLGCFGCGASPSVVIPIVSAAQTVDMSRLQSFELWILNQAGRDGQPLSCDQLLRRTLVPSAPNNVRLKDPISGTFGPDPIAIDDIPAGEQNRLFFIDLYAGPDLTGERVASGCLPSVTIPAGERARIELRVQTPP